MTTISLKNLDHSFDLRLGEVGVTVRAGTKWQIDVGTKFKLVEQYTDNSMEFRVGYGKAIGWWSGKFNDVPQPLLSMEHNVAARDRWVLFNMMQAGYGDDFSGKSIVTALIYERI